MAKLKQKSWFTLTEAATYLSHLVQESSVSEADLVHYAMTGDLLLSIYFPDSSPSFPLKAARTESEKNQIPYVFEYYEDAASYCDIKSREEIIPCDYRNRKSLPRSVMTPSLTEAAKNDFNSGDSGENSLSENAEAQKELKKLAPNAITPFAGVPDTCGLIDADGEGILFYYIEHYRGGTESMSIKGLWDVPMQGDWSVYLEHLLLELNEHADPEIVRTIKPEELTRWRWPPSKNEKMNLKVFVRRQFFGEDEWALPIFSEMPRNAVLAVTPENLENLIEGHRPHSKERQTTEVELQRLQRTIAALAIGLADKFPTYRNGAKPNALQLARLATDHLRDATSDRTPHGFSETTARQTITEALKACPELSTNRDKAG